MLNFCSKMEIGIELFWGTLYVILCPSTTKNKSNDGSGIPKLHSGGIDRAFRRICVISAAISEPPADLKCQFGGFSPISRRAIQREYCTNCSKCSNNCNICHI